VNPRAPDLAARVAEWVHHESLHGLSPIARVCERADKTPLHGEVSDAYDPAKERILVRKHTVDMALRSLKRCL
jgi:hypothetical protein